MKIKISANSGAVKIIAFCCQNSALEAAKLAEQRKLKIPEGLVLIESPCAGKVDPDYILRSVIEGADGVMVMGCHS